jgi:hypothetical protein
MVCFGQSRLLRLKPVRSNARRVFALERATRRRTERRQFIIVTEAMHFRRALACRGMTTGIFKPGITIMAIASVFSRWREGGS